MPLRTLKGLEVLERGFKSDFVAENYLSIGDNTVFIFLF